MKIIAKGKGINLTPRAPKQKKEDKYSELSDIKKVPKFNVEDKVVFVGLIVKYRGQECTIVKRSLRKDVHYYKIRFEDDYELKDITSGLLKTIEEYEQWLLDQENGIEDNHSDLPEIELEMIKNGIESHKNYHSCLSPLNFHYMDCISCTYKSKCVYENKFDYKKTKYN